MIILVHNIGDNKHPNYNTKEEIQKSNGLLTFDGVYKSVFDNKDTFNGKKFIMFVIGAFTGQDNRWDVSTPYEKFCTWEEIFELQKIGGEIGWHTWTHKDLRKLTDEELKYELTPPFPMKLFAYPYGYFDDRVIKAVKEAGFEKAYSVEKGDNTDFKIIREYIK